MAHRESVGRAGTGRKGIRSAGFAGFFSLFLLLCAAFLLPVPARAATDYAFSFASDGAPEENRVNARLTGTDYTVYLPGFWDTAHLRIWFDRAETMTVGDITVRSGEELDVSPLLGQKMSLKRNGTARIGSITFLQGSAAAVQIRLDAKALRRAIKDKHVMIEEGRVLVSDAGGRTEYEGGLIQFKGRGNATYSNTYAKKPFQIKLEQKADLMGMGKGRTWLLIANYLDLSLLRNQINLDLAREMGMRGAVECVQADLWLNGDYAGLYLLTEKVQINKNRLDLRNLEEETEEMNDEPLESFRHFKESDKKTKTGIRGYEIPREPEDITGGYIVELEKYYRYESYTLSGFASSERLYFTVKEPTYVSRAQVTYISGVFEEFLRGLAAEDGVDPVSGKYYADLIDMESFAMKFLIEDFAKNFDALGGSQFFFKDSDDRDPRIYAGPCWDYDLCMGNINIAGIGNGIRPQKDWAVNIKNGKTNWYAMLYRHEDFRAEVRRVYREKFRPAIEVLIGEEGSKGRILRSLEEYEAENQDSARMNFTRYRPQNVTGIYAKSGRTHETSVTYLFKWIRERAEAMEETYGKEGF